MEFIKILLEKISNFLDLFDISYLVSGVATLGILSFLPNTNHIVNKLPDGFDTVWWFIACYIIGVACSALGRRINQRIASFNRRDHLGKYEHFENVLKVTKLDTTPWFQSYLITATQPSKTTYEENSLKNVYRLMWTSLRERKDIPESIALLRRYWVNSSTMDGLTVSTALGTLVGIYYLIYKWNGVLSVLTGPFWFILFCVLITRLFCQEANRNRRYQIEELVNTYILIKGL